METPYVFTFPMTSHPLQLVTFERRYDTLNMVRSLTKPKCAKIQHFECWPFDPPFKVNLSEKDDHRIATQIMTGITHSNSFKCWLPHIDDAVGGQTHKQLTQIGYHFKAEHLSLPTMIKSKQSLWHTDVWKAVFVFVGEWN